MNSGQRYEIMTPNTVRVDALRGYPATHIIFHGASLTLCGKPCEGWQWQHDLDADSATCKTCRKAWAAVSTADNLTVVIQTEDVRSVHLPSLTGNSATLCGITANEEVDRYGVRAVNMQAREPVSCLDCFKIWRVCQKYRLADFGPAATAAR